MTEILKFIVIILTAIFVLQWGFQHLWQPWCARRTIKQDVHPDILQRVKLLQQLYHKVDGQAISDQACEQRGLTHQQFLYGEIDWLGFYQLLQEAQVNQNDDFFDLGSGTGKAVFAASVLGGVDHSTGVELIPELNEAAHIVWQQFTHQADAIDVDPNMLLFINDDFHNVDLDTATLIFINATAYTHEQWRDIVGLLDKTAAGTRFIITSHTLPTQQYRLLNSGRTVMNWGLVNYHIYVKIPSITTSLTQST